MDDLFQYFYGKIKPKEINKIMWNCFGDNCYVMSNDRFSCYFDIISKTVYLANRYNNNEVYVWVLPEYRDLYMGELKERKLLSSELFVSSIDSIIV